MIYRLYRRPHNLGMKWRFWRAVDAPDTIAALKTTEFKDETMYIDQRDKRIGVLGGASEFIALTVEEAIQAEKTIVFKGGRYI